MECNNKKCKYHVSKPKIIVQTDLFKIGQVQGCRYGYCKLAADKNRKR